MCIFSAPSMPKDNSAEIARQREEARQADIRAGRENIDSAFSRFDDPFYNNIQTTYQDYFFPQVDQQFADTSKKLKLRLAGAGNLNSGAGAQQIGKLTQQYDLQRADLANKALDAANSYRTRVEGERGDLYNLNASSADPASIAVQAASRAGPLLTPPSPSPIGSLFADFLNNAAIGVAAESKGYPGFRTGLFDSSKSAQRIVN